MDKYYKAWETIYDYEKELREHGRDEEALLLSKAGNVVLERSNEEVRKEMLRVREENRLQLRTYEAPRPNPLPRPSVRQQKVRNIEISKTEWGTFFNIRQEPS
jgi:hypothetical protein